MLVPRTTRTDRPFRAFGFPVNITTRKPHRSKPTSKPKAISTPLIAVSAFVAGTLRSRATDGAGALGELGSALPAPHPPQNRVPGTNGLPHIMQNVLDRKSTRL